MYEGQIWAIPFIIYQQINWAHTVPTENQFCMEQ